MALKIRRGTDAERNNVTFPTGEIVWTTSDGVGGINHSQLWVGNGNDAGGVNVLATSAGYGLTWNTETYRLDVTGLTTDDIPAGVGVGRQYYSREAAQDDAALLLTSGTHVGISFQYNDGEGKINATVDASAFTDTGITDVVNDTSPQLGGNLDLNTHNITGTGNINVTGTITATKYGTVHAYQLEVSDNPVGPINAGIVLNTNIGGSTGANFISVNTHHNDVDPVAAFFSRSRGTASSPTALQNGDAIFNFGFTGTTSNGSAGVAVGIGAEVDGAPGAGTLPGKLSIYTSTSAGAFLPAVTVDSSQNTTFAGRILASDGTAGDPSIAFSTDGGFDTGFFHPGDGIVCISTNAVEKVRVDSGGMRVEGFMKVKDVNGTLPNPPEAGMIVLDGSTFKGYNGTSWVNLN